MERTTWVSSKVLALLVPACTVFLCVPSCTVRMEPADGGGDARAIDAALDAFAADVSGAPDGGDAAELVDAPRDTPDAWVDRCSPGCGDEEICGEMGDGNGLDDDCDDSVDEDCTCMAGTARACFRGPPDRRFVGICADGVEVCNEFGRYDSCISGQSPIPEACNGADDDCDGSIDDGIAGCTTGLVCPGSELGTPLAPHPLRASGIDGGDATGWAWTITCPDTVTTCPTPDDPSARDTEVFLVESDNYRVHLEVTLSDGSTRECEWIVYARGDGLRVELDWDTQGIGRGNTDVDLHLHRRSIPAGSTMPETRFFDSGDDCYYLTCKASTYGYDENALAPRWSLPPTTDLSVCEYGPEGALWSSLHGACFNPRLDVDIISCDPAETDPRSADFCSPENINVDAPPAGEPYRIWVNYYSAHGYVGDTHPTVNVYCYGELRGSFGTDVPFITLTNGDETTSARVHDSWWVADVVFGPDECGRPSCRIQPLGMVDDTDEFGPPWSF